MKKISWFWQLLSGQSLIDGFIEASTLRDAVSRVITHEIEPGVLVGNKFKIPPRVLHEATADLDMQYEASGEGFTIRIRKIVCPTEKRHPEDIVGCGSSDVSGPDEEGLYDCHACGMFFDPRTAYDTETKLAA